MRKKADFHAEVSAKAGGLLSIEDVAQLLGITSQAVEQKHLDGQILGVPFEGAIMYPGGQFKDGKVLLGIEPILAGFDDMHPWGQLQLMAVPLDGFTSLPASMLDMLAQGVDEDVSAELAGLARGWAV
jgi:hypothetical protein